MRLGGKGECFPFPMLGPSRGRLWLVLIASISSSAGRSPSARHSASSSFGLPLLACGTRRSLCRGLLELRGGNGDEDYDVVQDAFAPFDPRDSDDDALLAQHWEYTREDAASEEERRQRWEKLAKYGEALGVFDELARQQEPHICLGRTVLICARCEEMSANAS